MTEVPYVRQPVDFSTPVRYAHVPDSFPQRGVPKGAIVEGEWTSGLVFPGTRRRFWLYALRWLCRAARDVPSST